MKFEKLHSWDLNPKQAIALQRQLARHVRLSNSFIPPIKTIAGVDVSYKRHGSDFHAAIVAMDYETMEEVESVSASVECNFPYVPGLLSFRELPILLKAFTSLQCIPDIIIADAHGIAHPRKLGLASHLGLWLSLPTIGCAKNRLCGKHAEPALDRGGQVSLLENGMEIGRVVRTRDKVRPMFVSPGHLVDMESAAEIVLNCSRGYRMPEPTRLAHLLSNRVRAQHELKY